MSVYTVSLLYLSSAFIANSTILLLHLFFAFSPLRRCLPARDGPHSHRWGLRSHASHRSAERTCLSISSSLKSLISSNTSIQRRMNHGIGFTSRWYRTDEDEAGVAGQGPSETPSNRNMERHLEPQA
ncbi:hypothetical protein EJ06DRAFT_551341 [Trichodelitschia bisporula]|uniref:Uncharacterized protein n=1 Tax=Trichodelitschia bisporula TaxID=703511 RepID=A0A6G1HLM1_9PEZI|nr:hypothetical protein EJ06DRAFT_551341 [Trichodelitschia bisporula]